MLYIYNSNVATPCLSLASDSVIQSYLDKRDTKKQAFLSTKIPLMDKRDLSLLDIYLLFKRDFSLLQL